MPKVITVILLFFYSVCLCLAINDNPDDTPEEGQPNEQEVEAAYQNLQKMMSGKIGQCCISCLTAALATSVPGIAQNVARLTGDPYASIFAADIISEVDEINQSKYNGNGLSIDDAEEECKTIVYSIFDDIIELLVVNPFSEFAYKVFPDQSAYARHTAIQRFRESYLFDGPATFSCREFDRWISSKKTE